MHNIHFTLLFFLFFSSVQAQTHRYFVSPNALGQNNGLDWADAFTNLHDALVVAQAGDEIWVAGGIYHASETTDRNVRFELSSGVKLYGGFAATEMDLSERQPELNQSIIDGDIGTPGDSTDNSYNLLYMENPDSNTLVDGFIFRNAFANRLPSFNYSEPGIAGAALYIMAANGNAFPVIRNCVFEHNTALGNGGAVYINGNGGNSSVAPVFAYCRFTNNHSESNGGAMVRSGASWVDRPRDIDHCIFEFNSSKKRGGAILFSDAPRKDTFDIMNTRFDSNFAPMNLSGAPFASDIHLMNMRFSGTTTLNVKKCRFSGSSKQIAANEEYSVGGTLLCILDSIHFSNPGYISTESIGWSKFSITNTIFENGIQIEVATQTDADYCLLKNITVKNNSARIIFSTSNLEIDNFTIHRPKSDSYLYLEDINPGENGSLKINNLLIYTDNEEPDALPITLQVARQSIEHSIPIIINNLTAKNTKISLFSDIIKVYNSIFASPKHPVTTPSFLTSVFDHNLFSVPDTFSNNWTQTNNIWASDPMFVDPAAGDFRLQACSPAINAGYNGSVSASADILGNPRIQFDRVDMGAIETGPLEFATAPLVKSACIGSQNGEIDLSGLDLCPPAVYHWNGFPDNNTAVQPDLAPGHYTIAVTDARGRSIALGLDLPATDPPIASATAQPVDCGNSVGGTAFASVSNAVPPYSYNWGLGLDSVLNGLAAGNYTVTITDGRGCTATASAQVDLQGSLNVQVAIDPISCFGTADGSLTVTPTNGKAPFTWAWDNGPSGPTNALLGPGTYTGNLMDSFKCRIQWILPLDEPAPLSLTSAVQAATGPAKADGAITLDSLTGGTEPYTLAWGNGQTGLNLNGLFPGTYQVTMTDAHDCQFIQSFQVPFVVAATEMTERPYACRIFPNPAQAGVCTISGTGQGAMRLQIFDSAGKLVYEDNWHATPNTPFERKLSIPLPTGVYGWRVAGAMYATAGSIIID